MLFAEQWMDWSWVADHDDLILRRLREHVELTAAAVAIGIVVATPLVLVSRRWRAAYSVVLTVTGVLYTIPSLALFALLLPWTGLTRTTALIALVGYTLLILVRNAVTGLAAVPAEVREAARGMGYTSRRSLIAVELPLALPAIIAGIRLAVVTTVGLLTVASLIGHGGLGHLILDGLNRRFPTPLVVGSVLSVTLAVIADVLLLQMQRRLAPWQGGR
ncbi:MAG TPA: ABC transporter permease [Acidimicrobiales bacterium]|nr:ABC transporter permease [Acidimicrobiales bacterium]